MITTKSINIMKCCKINPSTCSSLVIFMYWACENHTFNATTTEKLQQHPLIFTMNRTYCMFFLWRLYLAPPPHPGQSTTLLWLERPSSMCAKRHTVAPSNNKDPTSCSSYFCLFAPYGCCSSRTSRSWWIAHASQRCTFTTTLSWRLQHLQQGWARLFEMTESERDFKLRKLRYK